jgi:hypothetical protein
MQMPVPQMVVVAKLPEWVQGIIQLAPILTLIVGLPVFSRIGKRAESRKTAAETKRTELENEKLEIELRKLRGEPINTNRRDEIELELKRVTEVLDSTSIEGHPSTIARTYNYVVRFLLLFLFLQAWDILHDLLDPLISNSKDIPKFYLPGLFSGLDTPDLFDFIFTFGSLIIFIVLGAPLLRDIAAASGVSIKHPFRRSG